DIQALDLAASKDVSPLATFSRKSRQGLNSLLGRVLYSYNDRYLFSASLRRDGSSKFAPGHKWGTFPAVSAGWIVSQEKFMEKVAWIDQLKLRGSWGLTGNNRIPDFVWVEQLYPSPYVFGGGNGTVVGGMIPSSDLLANEDVTWERTFQFNTGLDLSLFRGRLNVSLDMYESKSDQLLLRPEILGITGATVSYVNIGKVRNRGIELELNSTNVVRNRFRWTSSLNFSMNRNKLVSLPDTLSKTGEREDQYRNIVGGPMVQYWGYVTDGVFQSKAEADSLSLLYNASALSTSYFTAGGLKIRDLNGDHKLDQNDRTVIGNPYADFTWGINNNVTMGAFDLSFLIQGSQGGQIVNGDAGYNETKRVNRNYIDNRWISPMNPGDGRTPYSTNGGVSWVATDYMVEDASYWALRELIVGYTLPAKWTKAIRLSSARFYFTAQNLYYHFASGYRGINPEARMTSGGYNDPQIDGYQRGAFPLSKSYQFGIDVNF
ncbi:MAG: SusC/RagA family TonB-linked outer membrane protein, partial [Chitinophagaceae bacterium]